MKVHTVGAYGHQLTRFGLFNCYLVRESDSCTLIDTCLPGSAPKIVRAAQAAAKEPIARVLLTHAHGDHIGSLDALTPMLGKAEIGIGRREARLMPKPPAQDRSLDPDEPQCAVKGSFPGANSAPTHLFGDSSTGGGELYGSLRAVATPGHTPGHISCFDERDGTLYAGDALVCVGGRVHVPGFGPWYFPLPGMATWHRPTAVESARKLLALPIRRYAAGHGRLVEGGPELLERAIRQAELGLRKRR